MIRFVAFPDVLMRGWDADPAAYRPRFSIARAELAGSGDTAGAIFDVRLVKAAGSTSFDTEPTIVFKDH